MALHRMDFLVGDHQGRLQREAADTRLGRTSGSARQESSGTWFVPAMHVVVRTAWHDLRTQHLHSHHGHHRPHAA
jgi:hypothetical protein